MKSSVPFRISGLPLEQFIPWFRFTDAELASRNAARQICDKSPGFPCRVSLVDAVPGEKVILLPYRHHAVAGPYQSSGPIFVREAATPARLDMNEVPEVVRLRLMSIRAYDNQGMMVASEVIEGRDIEKQIETLFTDEQINYLHLHNARAGCYSCRVDRGL
jgi:uncharacterized protein DUF1203